MTPRVFVDANIVFSAALSEQSRARLVIESAALMSNPVRTSDYALREAQRNLETKAPEALDAFHRITQLLRIVPGLEPEPCPIALRAKDRPILAAAIRARADALVTSDMRDFGPYMDKPEQTGGVRILSLRVFIEMVGGHRSE